jgi:hypothetical protein
MWRGRKKSFIYKFRMLLVPLSSVSFETGSCHRVQPDLELLVLLPPLSSPVLGLQACATTPSFSSGFEKDFKE